MSFNRSLAQATKIVQMINPKTTNGGVTSQVISLKNCHKVAIVLDFTQAAGHATTPALNQATSIAAGTNKAGPASMIWANEDCAASDALVAKTAAASYAVTNDIKHKQVVFEVDPNSLDVAGGYDCLYVTIADSSQATNFVSATAYLFERYPGNQPPTAIVD